MEGQQCNFSSLPSQPATGLSEVGKTLARAWKSAVRRDSVMKNWKNIAANVPKPSRILVLLGICLAGETWLIPNGLAAEKLEFQAQAREQIRLLQEEKAARTPAQRKIDSQLVHTMRKKRFGLVAPGLTSLKVEIDLEPDGRVLVDLRAKVTPGLLEFIARNGGTVVNSFAQDNAIRAHVPLDQIEALAARPEVRAVRPADRMATNVGPVTSGGDIAHRAAEARERYGANGAGVKIGVLSDSVTFLSQSQAAGELPTVTVLPGQSGGGTGEGTAMLEIVHDLAPGAQLYFATAVNGIAGFAQNIRDLHAAGCRVIVDDVVYFVESPLQDGPIARAINDVSAAGTLFFSSAGNGGSKLKNTSGTWEGDFRDAGPATFAGTGRLHDFGGTPYNTFLSGTYNRADLFWADPLGASTNDYDLYVLDYSGAVVRSSTNIQDGNDDPYESIAFLVVGERLVIVKASGEDRFLSLMTFRAGLSHSTPGAVRGHNASGAENAFSVAAVRVNQPAAPFDTLSPNHVEDFSSDGPRRIFFHADGSAITPGNFSATGGTVLDKPDLTAADGVATSVPGFANFLGTSAAAPHAAAIAGLLWSYNPLLSPAEIRAVLSEPALDIEGLGRDDNSGPGIVMTDRAFANQPFAPPPHLALQAVQLADGNTNGWLDANECGELVVTLRNLGLPTTPVLTGITATLETTTAAVVVDPEPRSFPEVSGGDFSRSLTSFRISTSPLFNCGSNTSFVLHLSVSNQAGFDLPFELPSRSPGSGEPVTYTAMDLALPIPDLGSVESGILVTNLDRVLERVRVAVHLDHTFDYDLNLALIAPDGTEVLLSSGNGAAGSGYGASCSAMTGFSDDAATKITIATAPFVGTFRPQQALAAFRNKTGAALNGLWKLRVQDQAAADAGTLHCWSLELSPLACAAGGGQCLVPPAIVQGPTDQIVTNGDPVQFSIQAQGTAPLGYQWFFSPSNFVAASSLATATNATLIISNVSPAHVGIYSVVVSNLYGQQLSSGARLTVVMPELIGCSPNRTVALGPAWDFDSPVASGGEVTVSVLATTTNTGPGAGYSATRTWRGTDTNGRQTMCNQTIVVVDPMVPTITCAPEKTVPAGVSWMFDPPVATAAVAAPALVYDNSANDLLYRFDPGAGEVGDEIILTSPTAHLGEFSFEFWGHGPDGGAFAGAVQARVRFYRNDGPVTASGYQGPGTVLFDSGAFPIPASPRATVIFDNFEEDALVPLTTPLPGAFTWTVQFSGLSLDDHAGVDLYSPPVVGGNYTDYWEWENAAWVLKTNAVASMDFAARLTALSRDVTVTVLGTTTNTPSPNTTAVTRTWQATDAQGNSATCNQTVNVVVTLPPMVVVPPQSQVVNSGDAVLLSVTAAGAVPLRYQWYFNTTNLLTGATGSTLGLTQVQATDAGFYAVRVSNPFGTVLSQSATLTVFSAPQIIVPPASQIIPPGGSASFTVQALGYPELSYQWFFNETNLLAEATNAALTIANVQSEHVGNYSASVSNSLGVVTSQSATLQMGVAAFIAAQPQEVTVTPNATVQFTVGAGGTAPLSFQWYFNCDHPIAGGNSATLVLTNVSLAQNGRYCVVVSNHLGSETSQAAALRVLVPPDYFQIARTGSVVTLRFSTLTNQIYTVQYKDDIAAVEWSALRKGSNGLGLGSPMILQDPQATGLQRFYRVLIQ